MKHKNENGFILLVIIMLLSLIGIYLAIISGIMKTMQDQTDQMMLQSRISNIRQSGIAYLKANPVSNDVNLTFENDDLFKNSQMTILTENQSATLEVTASVGRKTRTQKFQVITNEK